MHGCRIFGVLYVGKAPTSPTYVLYKDVIYIHVVTLRYMTAISAASSLKPI